MGVDVAYYFSSSMSLDVELFFSLFVYFYFLFIFFVLIFKKRIQQASFQVYESTLRIYLDEFSGQKLKLKKDICLHNEKIYV